MKRSEFKDGVLFTIGNNKTVIRFREWSSADLTFQSVAEVGDYQNSYSLDMVNTGMRLYSYLGDIRVSGFIPFAKCTVVQEENKEIKQQPITV